MAKVAVKAQARIARSLGLQTSGVYSPLGASMLRFACWRGCHSTLPIWIDSGRQAPHGYIFFISIRRHYGEKRKKNLSYRSDFIT